MNIYSNYWKQIQDNADKQELKKLSDPRYLKMNDFKRMYYPTSLLW